MKLLIALLLLLNAPAFAENHYCDEIWAELQTAVREGLITYREAATIQGKCYSVDFKD